MSQTHRLLLSSGVSNPLLQMARSIGSALQAVAAELRRREAIQALNESEDRMLADIGITRGDIEPAVRQGRRQARPGSRVLVV